MYFILNSKNFVKVLFSSNKYFFYAITKLLKKYTNEKYKNSTFKLNFKIFSFCSGFFKKGYMTKQILHGLLLSIKFIHPR